MLLASRYRHGGATAAGAGARGSRALPPLPTHSPLLSLTRRRPRGGSRRSPAPLRYQPDDADKRSGGITAATASTEASERDQLLKQMLALSSLDDVASAESQHQHHQQQTKPPPPPPPQQQQQQRQQPPYSLYDDDSAADYDPFALDVAGYSSVSEYLDERVALAGRRVKVELSGAALWGAIAVVVGASSGGLAGYAAALQRLTANGDDGLVGVWALLLFYFAITRLALAVDSGARAMRERSREAEELERLARDGGSGGSKGSGGQREQRLAAWRLSQRLQRLDGSANHANMKFVAASTLLGLLLVYSSGDASGGASTDVLDDLQLRLEALDAATTSTVLVCAWAALESYFASLGFILAVVQLLAASGERVRYLAKWRR